MTPFSVLSPSGSGEFCVLSVEGHNLDFGAMDQQVELSPAKLSQAVLDDDTQFEQCCGGDQSNRIVPNCAL